MDMVARRMSPAVAALAALAALGAAGCEGVPRDRVGALRAAGAEGWTIFVYGHADHSLSLSLVRDLQEMQAAALGPDVNVTVLADFDGSQREAGFDTGTTWVRITGGGGEPEVLDTGPELDLDDPAVLAAAVGRAFSSAPAEHLGLVMWDHGGTWDQGFGGDTQDGTRPGRAMKPAQLGDAIAAGLEAAGADDDPPLDFLAFDTCLMAGPEVLYELAGLSRVAIASAEIDYGGGWDYARTLTWISDNPGASAVELAAAEVRHWDAHHAGSGADDALLRSHVALDMSGVDELAAAMARLSSTWQGSRALADGDLGRAAFFTLPGYSNGLADILGEPELRDLGQFLDLLSVVDSDPAVADAASAAYDALDAMVIASSLGDLRAAAGQVGVNFELPAAVHVAARLDGYRAGAGAWNRATDWAGALADLAGRADRAAPRPSTDYGADGAALVFRVDEVDAAMATTELALLDGEIGDVLELGVVAVGAIEPGVEYEVAWGGTVTTIGGVMVSVQPWITPGTDLEGALLPPIFAAPGVIGVEGEDFEAALLFGEGDGAAEAAVIWESGRPALLSLSELAGTTFTPMIPGFNTTTGEEFREPGASVLVPEAGSLPIDMTSAPAGDYFLFVAALDYWGNLEAEGEVFRVAP